MKKTLRAVAAIAASALALTACGPQGGSSGDAADYPTKNMEMTVGFAAGGHNDVTARKFAAALEEELGQKVMVVNRTGGGGVISATEASRAKPDGYNLFFAPTGAFTSAMLQQQVTYKIEDFRSIQPVAENAFVIAVPKDSKYKSYEDITKDKDRVTFSHFGKGHPTHLIGEEIVQNFELNGEAVPYDGSPEALQAIANGDVSFGIQDITSALPRLKNGDIRALAVSTEERNHALPDVPSFTELDLEEVHFSGSQALVVQKDVPAEIVEKLEEAAAKAVEDPEFVKFVEDNANQIPDVEGEAWFGEFMPQELERFEKLYEKLGIDSK
ncbi:tripartite tricarboxylate transporter substrate binding protein [Micrococcoides hystricis]|uniref:Tripartite tricarboxylate transporter substrate binding protein n=1 Tax=Micrococcoides hystricis TaxID=1572761 RepID=A0ABV6PBD4_9MICC